MEIHDVSNPEMATAAPDPQPSPTRTTFEQRTQQWGERSGTLLESLGFSRLAGGILLILLGALILALPEFIVWFVGIGAIVLGVLTLASNPDLRRP